MTTYKRLTVKRNWKKKIKALCDYDGPVRCYSLANCFSGEEFTPENMETFVARENDNYRGSNLTYNKVSGACVIHVHSNLWYEWTNKINW